MGCLQDCSPKQDYHPSVKIFKDKQKTWQHGKFTLTCSWKHYVWIYVTWSLLRRRNLGKHKEAWSMMSSYRQELHLWDIFDSTRIHKSTGRDIIQATNTFSLRSPSTTSNVPPSFELLTKLHDHSFHWVLEKRWKKGVPFFNKMAFKRMHHHDNVVHGLDVPRLGLPPKSIPLGKYPPPHWDPLYTHIPIYPKQSCNRFIP